MQCRTCGATLSTNTQQCPACGTPVSTEQQQNQYAPAFSTKATASSYPGSPQIATTSTEGMPSILEQQFQAGTLPGSSEPLVMPVLSSRKKRKPGLLAGMIVGILVVVLIGAAFIIIPALTTTKTPSGNAIDPSAAALITDIATTSSVNPLTAAPGLMTQTFKTYSTVYVVFHLNLKKYDFATHIVAYIQARFYAGKSYVYQRMLIFTHQANGGFFDVQYNQATAGSVELYWCLKSDCSDGKLAQTTSFTITA